MAPSRPFTRTSISIGLAVAIGCGPGVPAPPEQACASLAAGDLVVTEFMADPAGADAGKQYIEIYNATDRTVDLAGLTLFQSMSDGSRLNTTGLQSGAIPTHGYYVVGDAGSDAQARPAYLSHGYGSELGALRHETGKLGLRCAATVITEVTYSRVTAGRARALDGARTPSSADAQFPVNWCDATEPLDALAPVGENFGSPGAPNRPCASGVSDDAAIGSTQVSNGTTYSVISADAGSAEAECFDSVTGTRRSLQRPAPGELLVSEIMPAPNASNNGPGEWFEVYATQDLDLNGLILANESSGSTTLTSDSCLSVKAGDWLLFARNSDAVQNGGLPAVFAVFGFTLADAGSAGMPERALPLHSGGDLIERPPWSKSSKGVALQRSSDSLDLGQGSKWCPAASAAGLATGDRGTPGAPNSRCSTDSVDAGSSSTLAHTTSDGTGGTMTAGSKATWVSGGTQSSGGVGTQSPAGGVPHASGSGGAGTVMGGTSSGGVKSTHSPSGELGGITSVLDTETLLQVQGGAASASTSTGVSAGRCVDGNGTERALITPLPGDLMITEVMSAPATNNNGAGEWFEVLLNTDVDLNELEFGNEGSGHMLIRAQTCLPARSGDRLLFARSDDFEQNGGLPFVTETFSFTLADTASDSHPERALVVRHAGIELHRFNWVKSTKGASWQRSESASSAPDGGLPGAAASTEPSEPWCVSPAGTTFGDGDRGTPGVANVPCR